MVFVKGGKPLEDWVFPGFPDPRNAPLEFSLLHSLILSLCHLEGPNLDSGTCMQTRGKIFDEDAEKRMWASCGEARLWERFWKKAFSSLNGLRTAGHVA